MLAETQPTCEKVHESGSVNESALVNHFCAMIYSPSTRWEVRKHYLEFNLGWSKPDVLLLTNSLDLIAIEAKTHAWRQALIQSNRNSVFANRSYVLLPGSLAEKVALNYAIEFRSCGIGLCGIFPTKTEIYIGSPRISAPHKRCRTATINEILRSPL